MNGTAWKWWDDYQLTLFLKWDEREAEKYTAFRNLCGDYDAP